MSSSPPPRKLLRTRPKRERRAPAGAPGSLRWLHGLLGRPVGLERRDGQWHVVLVEQEPVLLHATTEGRGVYERMGFAITGELRQHQGLAAPAQLVALPEDMCLRPLGRNDPKALIALDARAGGMPREALLRRLLAEGETVVLTRGD